MTWPSPISGETRSKTFTLHGGRPTLVNLTNSHYDGWLHDILYVTEADGQTAMVATARLWLHGDSPTEPASRSIVIPAGVWLRIV